MLPILFSLGSINIYSFGLFLFLAFIFGTFVVWKYGRKEASDEFIFDLIFYTLILSMLGGRIAFIISHPEIFTYNILKMLHLMNFPGFSYYAALITGMITLSIFSIYKKMPPLKVLDFIVLGLTLALILGQFGCFLNGCVVGVKTNLFWGLPVVGFTDKRHPLPLYEILILIPSYLLLLKISARQNKFPGFLSGIFFLILGISQFVLEFFRESSVYLFQLKFNQILNLIFILGSSILLLRGLAGNKIKSKIKNLFNK